MKQNVLPLRPNVCMLVLNKQNLLFLGERLDEPGSWQLPQGGVEEGSSLEENVIREATEELGVPAASLRILRKLDATNSYEWTSPPAYANGKWRGQTQTFWIVQFMGDDEEIDLAATDDPEFRSFRWCTPKEVREIAEPRRAKGYRAALAEFEAYLQTAKDELA